jgi:hypothetical protein
VRRQSLEEVLAELPELDETIEPLVDQFPEPVEL